jgi:glycosyltransferase involved in cell wall biosynthesis
VRVVYLHQYFVTPSMPGGTRSYEMAVRLASRGHDVQLITSDRSPGAERRVTDEDGVTVHWLPVPYGNEMSVGRRLGAFLDFARRAGGVARRLDPDLLFASSTPLTIALPALQAIAGRPVPLVFEVRDLWPDVPIAMGALRQPGAQQAARLLERTAYRHSTRIIALSEEMRAGVVAAGFPEAATAVIPNGSDVAAFRGRDDEAAAFRARLPWLGSRPLVVYAGTLGRVNGISELVQIAAAARDSAPEVRFLVVGSGAEEAAIRALAESLGVLDVNFFMLPPVPKSEMPAVLNAADLATSFVADIPGLYGGSANKLFDAFAAARPVAVNGEGPPADLLRESGAGLVLGREPATAARTITQFLGDAPRVAAARSASARLADERFARDLQFDRFEQVLIEARAEGRVSRALARRRGPR